MCSVSLTRSEVLAILEALEEHVIFCAEPDWGSIERIIHTLIAEFPDDSEISQFAHILKGKPRD